MEDGRGLSKEREEYIKNTIMSVLFELYEDQTETEYLWEEISTTDETA